MKFVFVLAALACTAAFGQMLPRSAIEGGLALKKSPLSFDLYRGNHVCAGLRDCDAPIASDASRPGFSPCAADPLSCHLAAESHDYGRASIAGFKFSGTMGHVTISLGRHGDNPLLAHSPVLEGVYQLESGAETHFGLVRHSDQTGSHPMLFFLFKKQL